MAEHRSLGQTLVIISASASVWLIRSRLAVSTNKDFCFMMMVMCHAVSGVTHPGLTLLQTLENSRVKS